jgi:amidase
VIDTLEDIAETAFVPGGRFDLEPRGEGPLSGLTFAVKDLIDIEGMKTGAGNPDWLDAARAAAKSAVSVCKLLEAGARCIGKTITDELAFSLEGRNAHYGTPVNPVRPDCLPGGSSSGSAVAVSAGACDFALGTDTGGSVRVPGAFCDLFAMRPSHGMIDMEGVTPFAPSYDTIGWFARDAATLGRVGHELLPPSDTAEVTQISVGEDVFALCDGDLAGPLRAVADAIESAPPIRLFPVAWEESHRAYARLQARDIRESLGAALARRNPVFGADIAPRFAEALADTGDCRSEETLRARCAMALRDALPPGTAALIPTAPLRCLPRDADGAALGHFYPRALAISAIAGHAGAPQVQVPTPVGGLSLIGAPGSDRALLNCVLKW